MIERLFDLSIDTEALLCIVLILALAFTVYVITNHINNLEAKLDEETNRNERNLKNIRRVMFEQNVLIVSLVERTDLLKNKLNNTLHDINFLRENIQVLAGLNNIRDALTTEEKDLRGLMYHNYPLQANGLHVPRLIQRSYNIRRINQEIKRDRFG